MEQLQEPSLTTSAQDRPAGMGNTCDFPSVQSTDPAGASWLSILGERMLG